MNRGIQVESERTLESLPCAEPAGAAAWPPNPGSLQPAEPASLAFVLGSETGGSGTLLVVVLQRWH